MPLMCFRIPWMVLLISQFSELWRKHIACGRHKFTALLLLYQHWNPAEKFRFLISHWPSDLEFHQTCPYRLLRAKNVWIFLCFTAYSALHITDTLHDIVLFSFVFCSNTKSSPVITNHYTCCYVTWTDILHSEIILLLKEVNKGLLKFELT